MTYKELTERLLCLKNDLPTHIVEHGCIDLAIEALDMVESFTPPNYGIEEYVEEMRELDQRIKNYRG